MKLSAVDFYNLEAHLIKNGEDADLDSFCAIKQRLKTKELFTPYEFARQAIYVVLASGFSQKTAKRIHCEIMGVLESDKFKGDKLTAVLFSIFHNRNKTSAITKIWENREQYRNDYYKLKSQDEKLKYLSGLPHIGKITANHLARNLGENVFKRDVWIDRLLKEYGEDLIDCLEQETKLPRGYIDVVLWKSCQKGLIKF
jgi:hypothetical protein